MCLGLGSAATWQPSVPVPLYSAWQQASTHTLLSRKFQTIPASYQLKWTFQPAKNVPRARDLFPFHSSLPGVQVPSSFIFFFFPPFFLPSYVGSLLQLWLYKRSSASFQLVFCENCSTCRCIIMCLWGEVSSTSYSTISTSAPERFFLSWQELKYHQDNYPRYVVLFYFAIVLDSQKSCRDSTESFPTPFTQLPSFSCLI